MAADWKERILDLFTSENGPFSTHEIMDRLEIPNNALVNVALFELVRQGVVVQTNEMPPKWELSAVEPAKPTEEICTDEKEGKLSMRL